MLFQTFFSSAHGKHGYPCPLICYTHKNRFRLALIRKIFFRSTANQFVTCEMYIVHIKKTIVQSLSFMDTFSLSFMKGNHFGDNETCRFANKETIRRIQRAGDRYSDKELMLQFYLPSFTGGYTSRDNKGRRTLGMCNIVNPIWAYLKTRGTAYVFRVWFGRPPTQIVRVPPPLWILWYFRQTLFLFCKTR